MSLKHYQNLWLKTIFAGLSTPLPSGLSEVEQQHLQRWGDALSTHKTQQQELQQYLLSLLPKTVCKMLSPEILEIQIQEFIEKQKRIDPQHPQKLIQDLLLFLASVNPLSSEHFVDLCRYESTLRTLNFHQQPTVLPAQKGPRLASWASVIYLGPFFPLVIATLKQASIADVSFSKWQTIPQTPYLLLQEFKGERLVKIAPLVAECLEQCHGKNAWQAIVERVIKRHPELALQTEIETLLHIEAGYLTEGILLRSATFFELG